MCRELWQDVRYAARVLLAQPRVPAVAILSLMLGVGANTAIFQLIDAVRLRTLPVAHPETLAEIRVDTRGQGRTGSFTGRYRACRTRCGSTSGTESTGSRRCSPGASPRSTSQPAANRAR